MACSVAYNGALGTSSIYSYRYAALVFSSFPEPSVNFWLIPTHEPDCQSSRVSGRVRIPPSPPRFLLHGVVNVVSCIIFVISFYSFFCWCSLNGVYVIESSVRPCDMNVVFSSLLFDLALMMVPMSLISLPFLSFPTDVDVVSYLFHSLSGIEGSRYVLVYFLSIFCGRLFSCFSSSQPVPTHELDCWSSQLLGKVLLSVGLFMTA
jgi:hypothetical protein